MNQKLSKKKRGPGSRLLACVLCCSLLCGMIPSVSADEMESETLAMTELAAETMPETPETEPATAASQEETVQEVTGAPETEAPATESAAAEAPGNSEYETSLPDTEPSTGYEEQTTAPDTTETTADSEQQSDVAADTEMPAEDATDAGDEKTTEDEALTETASEEQTEAETEEKKPEFSYETVLDGVTVTIHAEEGILPEGTTVTVKPLDDAVLEKAAESINDRLTEKEVVQIIGFDICFFDPDGNELHDLDDKVKVVYSGMDIVEEAEEAQVYHADEEGNITHTLTDAAAPSETVEFASDQFSPVLYATYNDGISTLANERGSVTVGVGNTTSKLSGTNNSYQCGYENKWSSSDTGIAIVDSNGRVTGVSASTEPVTISHTYCNSSSSWHYWHSEQTETWEVTVTEGENEGAMVFYLKTPSSDPDSNDTNQWGEVVRYNNNDATVNTTGATWPDDKNVFKADANVAGYIVSWPDGSTDSTWKLNKTDYPEVYNAVYEAYKTQLENDLGITNLQKDDIEEITLVPYKISRHNGEAYPNPDKHIDCTISVKCSKAYVARFNVQYPGDVDYRNVRAENKKIIGGVADPIAQYLDQTKVPEFMTGDDGITYRFDGWYNEAKQKVGTWPYTPGEEELDDGTVNFYAHYVPATINIKITKIVSGSMGDVRKNFEFSYSYGDEEGKKGTFLLSHNGENIISNVPIGAELTLKEGNAQGYTTSATYGGSTVSLNENGEMVFTIDRENREIVVTNRKDGAPDTGIILDSLPYVLILVIVVVGGVLFLRRRRNRYEN